MTRVRLFVVLGLLGAWCLRWSIAQTETGVAFESGPARTGVVGALALIAAWGLAATALLARDARAIVRGAAWTEAAIATLTAAGLFAGHPALPAPSGTGFVFAGLALLCAFPFATIRGAAALLCAVLLGVAGVGWAAGVALLLGAFALGVGRSADATSARRGIEVLSLLVALLLLVAPWLPSPQTAAPLERSGVYEGFYLWVLLSIALVLLAVLSFPLRREARGG